MKVFIHDDFDLAKICASGQCFRPGPTGAGGTACAGQPAVESADAPAPAGAPLLYRFITGNHVLFIRHLEGEMYDVSCREEEWSSVWRPYFDLDRCYADVRASIPADDPFLTEAASFSRGIRIPVEGEVTEDAVPEEIRRSFALVRRRDGFAGPMLR